MVTVIHPNWAPVASFTMVPATGPAPLLVQMDASGSSDPDGNSMTFTWDFGNGIRAAGPRVGHTYVHPGTWTVTLTASDGQLQSVATARAQVIAGVSTEEQDSDGLFFLAAAYPNPFNPETMIRYKLPVSTSATLNVFDSSGVLVRTLKTGPHLAGWHEARFDGSTLASGLYLYVLRSGSMVGTGQMVLIR